MIAEVAVSLPLRETFHYRIPSALRAKARPGVRAVVPFGPRQVAGTIVALVDQSPFPKLKSLLRLMDEEPVFRPDLLEVTRWIAETYQAGWGEALSAALPGALRRSKGGRPRPRKEEEPEPVSPSHPLNLTAAQKRAFDRIQESVRQQRHGIFLLHGITSSGKTEIYLQTIQTILEQKRTAIVLVPEISLTPQAIERFEGRFGREQVAILHSAMLESRRLREWNRIRSGEARVVIGARSAIFAPVENLGLVVVDEEHDPSYKQEDAPRYHAREVAIRRAKLCGAVVILGSATPSMETYYQATATDRIQLLELRERIDEVPLPAVQVVDMREQMAFGRRSRIFSRPLEEGLAEILESRQQAILFLNRRGFSTFIHCRKCGHVLRCKGCDVSFTYHIATKQMVCHSCRASVPPPELCPNCKSDYVRFQGIGTEKVESDLARFFPAARIARMDSDATQVRGSHAKILQAFSRHEIDVLVGTQMVAKGLDFPRVTLVGVISADTALNLPDFRSAERTFHLLTQVAGRAGRSRLPGKVIVQTYTPHHYAILAAKDHDYSSFYRQELEIRRQVGLPPFVRLVRLTARALHESKVVPHAEALAAACRRAFPPTVQVIGPAPAPIPKLRRQYRWQVLLKTPSLEPIQNTLPKILKKCRRPAGCYLAVDVDPL